MRRPNGTPGAPPSFWLEACGEPVRRPPLDGDRAADVVIVGGGFTGLWTALHLRHAAPDCRIVVVEREYCGFGASGRNGGWCSALFPTPHDAMMARHGWEAARRMQQSMVDTVEAVGRDIEGLGIPCDWARGGTITLATNPAHVGRLRSAIRDNQRAGFDDGDLRWLGPAEVPAVVRVAEQHGATFTPHCAVVQPAKLVRGLALEVARLGVTITEGTTVVDLAPGRVDTDRGRITADVVLRCTEGYTASLPRLRRSLVPIYSMMIATEPLPAEVWDEIGLESRPTFSDGRHLLVYGQRTADGRLAFGGRGAPYHFGSSVRDEFDRDESVRGALIRALHRLFPVVAGAEITHHWGGPLGVPRDWSASVGIDRRSGIGWAGGFVGDGVATSHLAGRTLADLVIGHDTDLVRLPWVQHRSPDWEPEPLRWIGINITRMLAATADRREDVTRRPSRRLDRLMGLVTGD